MGVDYTVYVGPYLQCVNPEVERVKTKICCRNKDCSAFDKILYDKFCSKCGSPQSKVAFTVKGPSINTDEIVDEIDEALYNPFGDQYYFWSEKNQVDIWLPNRHRPNKNSREFSFDPRECDLIIQELNEITQEIVEFQDQYKKEIEILHKHYNDLVVVKWGLLSMAH